MRRLRLFALVISVAISIEALFRWLNGVELTLGWLAERAVILIAIVSVSAWGARSELKRARRRRKPSNDIPIAIFAIFFGGFGAVYWGWRMLDSFINGRIVVDTQSEAYTSWVTNPPGFAVAAGLGVLGLAFYLLIFIFGIVTVGDALVRRHNRRSLDKSSTLRS